MESYIKTFDDAPLEEVITYFLYMCEFEYLNIDEVNYLKNRINSELENESDVANEIQNMPIESIGTLVSYIANEVLKIPNPPRVKESFPVLKYIFTQITGAFMEKEIDILDYSEIVLSMEGLCFEQKFDQDWISPLARKLDFDDEEYNLEMTEDIMNEIRSTLDRISFYQ